MTDGEGATPQAGAESAHGTADSGAAHAVALAEAAPTEGVSGNGGDGGGVGTLVAERPRPEPEPPAETVTGTHLEYNPALDGIRGLAVAAVLLFHGGFSWARGGYLGVSTFFTLSGFLITSLLIAEHRSSGRVSLTGFWARRLRRLLPPAAVTLAGVALAAFATNQAWERDMTGDVVSSALNVANWRFLVDGTSYGDQFDPSTTSPVLHFWSLAIEEQFYWLFPLLTVGVLALARGRRHVYGIYGAVLAGLLVVSGVLTLWPGLLGIDQPDADVVYYATPIRMGEILVGALLAVAVIRGHSLVDAPRLRPLIVVAGFAALAASAWAWWNVERQSDVLGDGGLLAYAGVSAALVLAACVPGPLRRALSFEPLRLLGVVSYGVYLFHWPIFRLLSEERVDQLLSFADRHPRGVNLFVVRLVPTLLVAVVSYHLLERPIRSGRWPKPTWPRPVGAPVLALSSVAAVVLVAVLVPRISEPPEDEFVQMAEEMAAGQQGPDPATLAPQARVGLAVGDSTMMRTAWGLSAWGAQTGALAIPGGSANLGCGIAVGGDVEYGGDVGALPEECGAWDETVRLGVDQAREHYGHVDFAVVQTGPWDVANRRVDLDGDGDEEWSHIGEPDYDAYLRDALESATGFLLGQGLTVVWLTAPTIEPGRNQEPSSPTYPEAEPDRMARLNEMITGLAAAREGVVVVDLAGWVANLPEGEDARLRPDGVHFDLETTAEVANWLAPELLLALEDESAPVRSPES